MHLHLQSLIAGVKMQFLAKTPSMRSVQRLIMYREEQRKLAQAAEKTAANLTNVVVLIPKEDNVEPEIKKRRQRQLQKATLPTSNRISLPTDNAVRLRTRIVRSEPVARDPSKRRRIMQMDDDSLACV